MRWRLSVLWAALVLAPASLAQADVERRVQDALDAAFVRGDAAVADWNFSKALLDYGSAFFLFPRGRVNASVYGKIGPIVSRLALREPARLKRWEELLTGAACRQGPKADPICVEEYAAVLLRLERPGAAEQLSLLERLQAADPATTVLVRLVGALASIQLEGLPDSGLPPTSSPNQGAMDVLVGLANRTSSPLVPATGSVVAYYSLIWAHSDDPGWQRDICEPEPRSPDDPRVEEAQRLLVGAATWARYSTVPDAARALVRARLAECEGRLEAALAFYRAALVLPFHVVTPPFRDEALRKHASLMHYLADRETRLEEIVRRRAEAGATRAWQRLTSGGPSRPVVDAVTVMPAAIVAPGKPMAARTGRPREPVPLVVVANVSAATWLRQVSVIVEDADRPGTRIDGIESDPLRVVHFQDEGADRRQVRARLALPAVDDGNGYRVIVRAVGIDNTVVDHAIATVPIHSRTVVYDLPPPPKAKRRAALVGVGQYPGGKVSPLATPPNDARALRRLLTNPLRRHDDEGFDYTHISILPDGEPATDGRHERVGSPEFSKLLRGLTSVEKVDVRGQNREMRVYRGQTTLFYFAGHGGTVADPGQTLWDPEIGEVDRKEGCLLFSDTEHGDCGDGGSILTTNVGQALKHLTVKGLISILDFCYSSDARVLNPDLWMYSPRPHHAGGAVTLSASTVEAFDLGPVEHGLFTAVVLEGLRGAADAAPRDDRVTALELWTYVQQRMSGIVGLRDNDLVPAQVPALTSREWKEEVVLVNNGGMDAVRTGLARQVSQGRLSRQRLAEANLLLTWDPDPTEWREVLDLELLRAFAEGALGGRSFEDVVDLLSQGQRAALLGGRMGRGR
jgi:hypothetical protein